MAGYYASLVTSIDDVTHEQTRDVDTPYQASVLPSVFEMLNGQLKDPANSGKLVQVLAVMVFSGTTSVTSTYYQNPDWK